MHVVEIRLLKVVLEVQWIFFYLVMNEPRYSDVFPSIREDQFLLFYQFIFCEQASVSEQKKVRQ